MRGRFAVALIVVVGCGASQKPTTLDDGEARSTTPDELCTRYVQLAGKGRTVDASEASYRKSKCLSRVSKDAPEYPCLVKCTFAADDWGTARGCRFKCGIASPSRSAVNPNPIEPPGVGDD